MKPKKIWSFPKLSESRSIKIRHLTAASSKARTWVLFFLHAKSGKKEGLVVICQARSASASHASHCDSPLIFERRKVWSRSSPFFDTRCRCLRRKRESEKKELAHWRSTNIPHSNCDESAVSGKTERRNSCNRHTTVSIAFQAAWNLRYPYQVGQRHYSYASTFLQVKGPESG